MTTANTTGTRSRLPDPPEREPDNMTSFDHLAKNGTAYRLAHHLGRPETTIVSGEHYHGRRTRHAGRGPGLPRPAGRLQCRPPGL